MRTQSQSLFAFNLITVITVFFTVTVILSLLLFSGCTSTPETAAPEESGYKIGDTGPGGGIIFYDDSLGITIDGKTVKNILPGDFRYLEAAPADWNETQQFQWGYYDTDIPGLAFIEDRINSIGKGKEFSDKIIAAGTLEEGTAIAVCTSYAGGGKNDWYLPSHGELFALFLKKDTVGGFTADYYWSSSAGAESSSSYAQAVNFDDGWISTDRFRDTVYMVRPVRIF